MLVLIVGENHEGSSRLYRGKAVVLLNVARMLADEEAKESYRAEYSVEERNVTHWAGVHFELTVGPWYVRIVDEAPEIAEADIERIKSEIEERQAIRGTL